MAILFLLQLKVQTPLYFAMSRLYWNLLWNNVPFNFRIIFRCFNNTFQGVPPVTWRKMSRMNDHNHKVPCMVNKRVKDHMLDPTCKKLFWQTCLSIGTTLFKFSFIEEFHEPTLSKFSLMSKCLLLATITKHSSLFFLNILQIPCAWCLGSLAWCFRCIWHHYSLLPKYDVWFKVLNEFEPKRIRST